MAANPESTGKATTMLALKSNTAPELAMPVVQMGFATLQSFELMQRAAKLLAASSLVPEQYRGNLPNCVIALNMAQRIGADPLMVMQNLYVVQGRPGWSAQFLIASFNQSGRFSAIRYKWGGTEGKDDWSCQAYARERDSNEVLHGPTITIGLAKKEGWHDKNGSKWKTIPHLMLMYRAAAWLVRTHAPEIAMGLQTVEELHDVFETRTDGNGRFAVDLEELRPDETSVADYIKSLREAGDKKTLESAWQQILSDFTERKREVPIDIEAVMKECKEALTEHQAE